MARSLLVNLKTQSSCESKTHTFLTRLLSILSGILIGSVNHRRLSCYLSYGVEYQTTAGGIVGSLCNREVACSASDRQGSNFESCVWRTVSSQSSHHPQEVLLAQFSLYVHKGGLKPDSFLFFYRRGFHDCLRVIFGDWSLLGL